MAPFSGLPAFGSASGSAAKAVPTVAFTAIDEPDADALGPILTTAPLPADAVGEAMAILLARPWTTSFHVASSSSPLVHCDNRRAQLLRFSEPCQLGHVVLVPSQDHLRVRSYTLARTGNGEESCCFSRADDR
ncbi:hypothetical protein F5148DRAFT_1150306 [Russula earlei]|uniref:Uncharacterized protein n=1 Tax=Russula earlei TaxID=71964 RepID=A0ACC0U6A2_9AGAM|nr:hypothetical protein F5148DRAFT_1150306 [Russula earlei]